MQSIRKQAENSHRRDAVYGKHCETSSQDCIPQLRVSEVSPVPFKHAALMALLFQSARRVCCSRDVAATLLQQNDDFTEMNCNTTSPRVRATVNHAVITFHYLVGGLNKLVF